jgi:hypothetical protein
MNRGNETPEHLIGKRNLGAVFTRRQFRILYEHQRSDVFAYRLRDGKLRKISGQHDLTPRTVLQNVSRDFRNGADGILILAPNDRLRAAFRRKLKRYFDRSVWTRVGIITYATCSALLARESSSTSRAVAQSPHQESI